MGGEIKKITVGLDVAPLYSGHKVRGIGFYTRRLLVSLKKLRGEGIVIRELKTREDIKREKFDLLHVPYFHPYFSTLPLRKNRPLVVTVHDLTPIKYPDHYPPGVKGKIRWQIQKRFLRRAERIITDSQASKKDIVEFVDFPKEKIDVVYLAAGSEFGAMQDKKRLLRVKKKYNLPDKFVLYVGDVNWNKNVPGLVKACEKIDVPLVIVGKQAVVESFDKSHPENRDLVWLQERVKKSKLIRLLGFISDDDLVAIYNSAVIYCQPSFDEGFGLPVLEAMACGCPVVSSNGGSLPEVAGGAALLVKPTIEGLEKGIRKMLRNDGKREEFVKRGFEWVKRFSWSKTAKETNNVYLKALEEEKLVNIASLGGGPGTT